MRVPATAAAFFFENGQQHVAAMHLRQKRAGGKFQPIVASGIDNSGIHLRQRQDKIGNLGDEVVIAFEGNTHHPQIFTQGNSFNGGAKSPQIFLEQAATCQLFESIA